MRHDAEKLKFFSFAASLKKREGGEHEKKTLTIYGLPQLSGKKNATSVNLPLRNLYCDDFLCGASTAQEALSIYKEAKQIMASGGFNLRKWNSNDSNVLQEISKFENSKGLSLCDNVKVVEDDQTYSKYINGTVKADDQLKVLGVGWDNNKDILQVDLSGIAAFAKGLPKTKRSVLKIAAKVFDPMGYLAVLTIMFKVHVFFFIRNLDQHLVLRVS